MDSAVTSTLRARRAAVQPRDILDAGVAAPIGRDVGRVQFDRVILGQGGTPARLGRAGF